MAGQTPLTIPIPPATSTPYTSTMGAIQSSGMYCGQKKCTVLQVPRPAATPTVPPTKAMSTDSPSTITSTSQLGKPIAFKTAISVVRSRIDIAMAFAATNVKAIATAIPMYSTNSCRLPANFANIAANAWWLCDSVGFSEFS